MNKQGVSRVLWLGVFVAGMIFVGVGSCLAAPGGKVPGRHDGEEILNRNLLEVRVVDQQIRLTFTRPEPAFVTPDFTISQCGRELAPTVATLTAMIGKASNGWAFFVDGKALYHRLEFECR